MACHLISRVSLPTTLPCSIFLHISTLQTGPLELTLLTSPTKWDSWRAKQAPLPSLSPRTGLDWSQPVRVPVLTDRVELRFPFIEQLSASHRPPPELYKGRTLLPLALKGHLLAPGSLPRALPFLNLHSLSIYSSVSRLCRTSAAPHQKVIKHGVSFPLATTMHALKEQQRWAEAKLGLPASLKYSHAVPATVKTV